MVSRSRYRFYTLYRGLLKDYDEYESDVDFGDMDALAYNMRDELDTLQPHRDPRLELEYMGITGDLEMIFHFRTTWMDRESDIHEYLDEVQEVIENGMDILITEKQLLGTRQVS